MPFRRAKPPEQLSSFLFKHLTPLLTADLDPKLVLHHTDRARFYLKQILAVAKDQPDQRQKTLQPLLDVTPLIPFVVASFSQIPDSLLPRLIELSIFLLRSNGTRPIFPQAVQQMVELDETGQSRCVILLGYVISNHSPSSYALNATNLLTAACQHAAILRTLRGEGVPRCLIHSLFSSSFDVQSNAENALRRILCLQEGQEQGDAGDWLLENARTLFSCFEEELTPEACSTCVTGCNSAFTVINAILKQYVHVGRLFFRQPHSLRMVMNCLLSDDIRIKHHAYSLLQFFVSSNSGPNACKTIVNVLALNKEGLIFVLRDLMERPDDKRFSFSKVPEIIE